MKSYLARLFLPNRIIEKQFESDSFQQTTENALDWASVCIKEESLIDKRGYARDFLKYPSGRLITTDNICSLKIIPT